MGNIELIDGKRKPSIKSVHYCCWCGKPNARAYAHGINFCKSCYPVMRVVRLPLNHILVEKLQKKAAVEKEEIKPLSEADL